MSLKSDGIPPIPPETVRIARAACPDGTFAMQLRDLIGTIYTDEQFADLYPIQGQPAAARLSIGADHGAAICRRIVRSPSCASGQALFRGEICPVVGSDRCGL